MAHFDPDQAAAPGSGVFGLPFTEDESAVVLVPVPFEATTSYGAGAADGPEAIREASAQVDLFDVEIGRPYEPGIFMLDEDPEIRAWNDEAKALAAPVIEAGGAGDDAELQANLDRVNERSALVNEWVYEKCASLLAAGKIPCVIGGDHAVPFGAIRAYAERFPGLGILHLDAHADLRDAYEGFTWSHASIFHNVMERIPGVSKLVQVGIRDLGRAEHEYIRNSGGRVVTHFDQVLCDERFGGATWSAQVSRIVADLPQHVYLSFDIDGLDPTLCPHTGTPVPGGLSFQQVCALVAGVARSGRTIVGLDLCEVAPGPDDDHWDGNVGARLLYKMIGWMLRSHKRIEAP
ncbi:agmatinase family protein [Vulgatibacter incomptus]|uniref:Agmatinase n=1 Tax=Vulgatibacter incomptus TaxID=1391653 RepID=A0A0K1PI97_9BACT|nr:agmatinase family protein [Vulgatibacter incomptus]AKU93245.1 Agmatinase [Vulgatibacter incomptus]